MSLTVSDPGTDELSSAEQQSPWLTVGSRTFRSRCLVGVEQYRDPALIGRVLRAAGADVFITTFDLSQERSSLLLADIDNEVDLDSYLWIGTTSFAHSAEEAVVTCARLRELFGLDIIKLDVRDQDNLPDAGATVVAARRLLAEGFSLLPFIRPDLDTALELQDMGVSALRLMASPVASYAGIVDPTALTRCIAAASVPTVVEGGLGNPTDVLRAFELGADAVLVNTLVARAPDPERMARAVRYATAAGECLRG
jgi:thiazole synthase